jgi:hypothetical protein
LLVSYKYSQRDNPNFKEPKEKQKEPKENTHALLDDLDFKEPKEKHMPTLRIG